MRPAVACRPRSSRPFPCSRTALRCNIGRRSWTLQTPGIPVVSGWPAFAQSGALFTYGPRLNESYRRLAYYVARVLRGARPQDLPIERPSVFETIINLKTAKKLNIDVPRSVLARADEVIG